MLRTTIGIISTDSATAAVNPVFAIPAELGMSTFAIVENRAKANRPATMEGIPVITSTRKVIALPRRFLFEYSTR